MLCDLHKWAVKRRDFITTGSSLCYVLVDLSVVRPCRVLLFTINVKFKHIFLLQQSDLKSVTFLSRYGHFDGIKKSADQRLHCSHV